MDAALEYYAPRGHLSAHCSVDALRQQNRGATLPRGRSFSPNRSRLGEQGDPRRRMREFSSVEATTESAFAKLRDLGERFYSPARGERFYFLGGLNKERRYASEPRTNEEKRRSSLGVPENAPPVSPETNQNEKKMVSPAMAINEEQGVHWQQLKVDDERLQHADPDADIIYEQRQQRRRKRYREKQQRKPGWQQHSCRHRQLQQREMKNERLLLEQDLEGQPKVQRAQGGQYHSSSRGRSQGTACNLMLSTANQLTHHRLQKSTRDKWLVRSTSSWSARSSSPATCLASNAHELTSATSARKITPHTSRRTSHTHWAYCFGNPTPRLRNPRGEEIPVVSTHHFMPEIEIDRPQEQTSTHPMTCAHIRCSYRRRELSVRGLQRPQPFVYLQSEGGVGDSLSLRFRERSGASIDNDDWRNPQNNSPRGDCPSPHISDPNIRKCSRNEGSYFTLEGNGTWRLTPYSAELSSSVTLGYPPKEKDNGGSSILCGEFNRKYASAESYRGQLLPSGSDKRVADASSLLQSGACIKHERQISPSPRGELIAHPSLLLSAETCPQKAALRGWNQRDPHRYETSETAATAKFIIIEDDANSPSLSKSEEMEPFSNPRTTTMTPLRRFTKSGALPWELRDEKQLQQQHFKLEKRQRAWGETHPFKIATREQGQKSNGNGNNDRNIRAGSSKEVSQLVQTAVFNGRPCGSVLRPHSSLRSCVARGVRRRVREIVKMAFGSSSRSTQRQTTPSIPSIRGVICGDADNIDQEKSTIMPLRGRDDRVEETGPMFSETLDLDAVQKVAEWKEQAAIHGNERDVIDLQSPLSDGLSKSLTSQEVPHTHEPNPSVRILVASASSPTLQQVQQTQRRRCNNELQCRGRKPAIPLSTTAAPLIDKESPDEAIRSWSRPSPPRAVHRPSSLCWAALSLQNSVTSGQGLARATSTNYCFDGDGPGSTKVNPLGESAAATAANLVGLWSLLTEMQQYMGIPAYKVAARAVESSTNMFARRHITDWRVPIKDAQVGGGGGEEIARTLIPQQQLTSARNKCSMNRKVGPSVSTNGCHQSSRHAKERNAEKSNHRRAEERLVYAMVVLILARWSIFEIQRHGSVHPYLFPGSALYQAAPLPSAGVAETEWGAQNRRHQVHQLNNGARGKSSSEDIP